MALRIVTASKTCSACGRELPITLFGLSPLYKDGRRGQCTSCRSKAHVEYLRKHPEKRSKKPPGDWKKYKRSRESARRFLLNKRYGITPADYADRLAQQRGLCAVCETDSPGGRYAVFHVDHCHETGVVRGLLCHNCNVILGRFGDNLDGVMRFVKYLAPPDLSNRTKT